MSVKLVNRFSIFYAAMTKLGGLLVLIHPVRLPHSRHIHC